MNDWVSRFLKTSFISQAGFLRKLSKTSLRWLLNGSMNDQSEKDFFRRYLTKSNLGLTQQRSSIIWSRQTEILHSTSCSRLAEVLHLKSRMTSHLTLHLCRQYFEILNQCSWRYIIRRIYYLLVRLELERQRLCRNLHICWTRISRFLMWVNRQIQLICSEDLNLWTLDDEWRKSTRCSYPCFEKLLLGLKIRSFRSSWMSLLKTLMWKTLGLWLNTDLRLLRKRSTN